MSEPVDNRRKHLTILQNLYSNDRVLVSMAKKAAQKMDDTEHATFDAFQYDVGALFLELKDELDKGLEDLADVHPEETDPSKWGFEEWFQFENSIAGHKFEEIYRTMAKGEPNIGLIWGELENRIFVS